MAEYDNTNRGVLFKNKDKQADTHADWNGNINVDGAEFYLNAWVKESSKDGSKFLSLSVKPKVAAAAKKMAPPARKAAPVAVDLDDEVPF